MPTAIEIENRLRKRLPFLPSGIFNSRYRLVTGMFYSGIVERSHIMHRSDYFGLEGKVMINDLLKIGRASCRERVCQVRVDLGGRRIIKKKKSTDKSKRSSNLNIPK